MNVMQGHYSKLASGRVPPCPKAVAALSAWLARQEADPPDSDARRAEMRRLADDIAMQCIRLTALATSG